MRILVCGGAGYIGSHMVKLALEENHEVLVVDNLSTGHAEALPGADFHQGDIGDLPWMTQLLKDKPVDLIMHFCARSLVGESVQKPELYYLNNVTNTLALLNAMLETGHRRLVFSSSAAVYGIPQAARIDESHPKQPINPYGRTKWMVEQILEDFASAYGLASVSLRYFNAAGADSSGAIGEKHDPETHLIPNILKTAASGNDQQLKVFGTDYPTPDGSCVRDYIHVSDIASAHLLAGEFLNDKPGAHVFNLGNGRGFSVLEIIEAARQITGKPIDYAIADRRAGDPPQLVADASKAEALLGWKPGYDALDAIIETAWNWHKKGEIFGSD